MTGLTTSKGLSFAFQANSPYVNDFTLATLRLFETTFLDGLKRKWWDTANHCPEEEVASKNKIDAQDNLWWRWFSMLSDYGIMRLFSWCLGDNILGKIRVLLCRIPTYDLPMINADALPLTCRGTTISRVSQSSFEMTVACITWLHLLRLAIGLKISCPFINQWEGNPKPIATCTRDFFCALSNCDWTK